MTIKIAGLSKEQFASLAAFLSGRSNVIEGSYKDREHGFLKHYQISFARLEAASQDRNGVTEVALSVKHELSGHQGDPVDREVPRRFILQMFDAMGIFHFQEDKK